MIRSASIFTPISISIIICNYQGGRRGLPCAESTTYSSPWQSHGAWRKAMFLALKGQHKQLPFHGLYCPFRANGMWPGNLGLRPRL